MITIRPVTDLRYKYPEVEQLVKEEGPVYLTKNGYGSMVLMSIETYSALIDPTERALDTADRFAENDQERMTHEEVFHSLRESLNVKR
ncbi:MAG: type II toxin-antitoxin system Phd/YefM family antitoxin [Lachnospiraceae bacterium]|nr:type II toxin-antitoxin system Phd/YefM family antitoxin [Lachnospiraceae bacterium]MBQ6197515.1 type II toxin-antitoxin system Phd/YefM family antitoxin [Lachnospiraceae bacterium]